MWDLIVSVPDHCLSFYFLLCSSGHLESSSAQEFIIFVFLWKEGIFRLNDAIAEQNVTILQK